jgi:hypothetical protein
MDVACLDFSQDDVGVKLFTLTSYMSSSTM